jgi:protein-S-isoprenylcysteine O-methyltransferase Ste14
MSDGSGGDRLPSLGPRGEGWVSLQFVAIGLLVAIGIVGPPWPQAARTGSRVAGLALGIAGLALGIGGSLALGRTLTPLPRPGRGGVLVERGVYRLARHPIYGGVILLGLAWALWTSPLAVLLEAVLAGFFELKRRREEAWLVERYPSYASYRARVRRALIPWVW